MHLAFNIGIAVVASHCGAPRYQHVTIPGYPVADYARFQEKLENKFTLSFGEWCFIAFVDRPSLVVDGTHGFDMLTEAQDGYSEVRQILDTKRVLTRINACHSRQDPPVSNLDEAVAVAYLSTVVSNRSEWERLHPVTLSSTIQVLRSLATVHSDTLTLEGSVACLALARLLPNRRDELFTMVVDHAAGAHAYLGLVASLELFHDQVRGNRMPEAVSFAKHTLKKFAQLSGWVNFVLLNALVQRTPLDTKGILWLD